MRYGCTTGLAIAIAVAITTPADAATVALEGETLVYAAAAGERNIIDVVPVVSDYATGLSVYDSGAPLVAGPGCVRPSAGVVWCLAATIRAVQIETGDFNDLVTLRRLAIPAVVSTGDGSDLVETGAGADVVNGGDGLDTVVGNGGDDIVDGGPGGDLLQGGSGGDALDGKGGDDVIDGGAGSGDTLKGGAGQDLVQGGPGDDDLSGGDGADALVAGTGKDILAGGGGPDEIVRTAGDTVENARSNDTVKTGKLERSSRCRRLRVAMCWPDRPATAAAARVPTRKPPVEALPRRRGTATYFTIRVREDIVYDVRVRVQFRNRRGRVLRTMYARVPTRNWVNVHAPQPPRAAYTAVARCCY
jgi:hypothetical protein